MKDKLTIAVLNHSVNIGNHFFELSIMQDLKKVFSDSAEVIPVEGRHFFTDLTLTGKKSNYLDYGRYSKCDVFVLAGPIFQHKTLRKNFEPLFKLMYENGTKFVFLSAGSSHYSEEEVQDVRDFLSTYKPYVISTRDTYTYEKFGDLAKFSHDGICSAFFISKHFEPYETPGLGSYIVLNFEEAFEPDLNGIDVDKYLDVKFDKEEKEKCSKGGAVQLFFSLFKKYPKEVNGYNIIRTLHNFNPSRMKPFLRRPNQFASVNAYSYINIFANSSLVLARRVHACVPALSYGKPAMLFNNTGRKRLFDRVGLSSITDQPVVLDSGYLESEYGKFTNLLEKVKADLLSERQ